jgi:Radical SAM superfamily/Iron-sulfur cluster-binding domain
MLMTEPARAAEQIAMLADRGCVQAARALGGFAAQRGLLDQKIIPQLNQRIAAARPGELPADFRVFGIFLDSVISSLHFQALNNRTHAREAFRQAVRWIEIETSSQCNRRCSYCPNSNFDRMSANDFLDMDVYARMISDLAEIDYDGDIKFVGNNEFFMHEGNRRYVELAHKALPRAKITLFSNGDYLDRAQLEWAASAGVRLLIVSLHPGATKGYDDSEALRRAWLFQTQTGLALQMRHFRSGKGLHWTTNLGPLRVLVGMGNLAEDGHNWTGLLPGDEDAQRADPCTYPIRQFVVSHDADVFMCCVAFKERTTENEGMGAITGNLAHYGSIYEAYASPPLVAWRRSLFHAQVKADPCRTCVGHADYQEPRAIPLANYVNEQLALVPG